MYEQKVIIIFGVKISQLKEMAIHLKFFHQNTLLLITECNVLSILKVFKNFLKIKLDAIY